MTHITIESLDALPQAAARFAPLTHANTVIAFHGEMGAGKTTFIRQLTKELGVEEDIVNSPSFSLINEYRSETTGALIYHFDLYRLENIEQAVDIGIEDYLESGALCLIEWPDVIDPLLPNHTLDVRLTVDPDTGARTLSIPDDTDC